MDRLDAARLFLAVADQGSFVAAARSLRVSPAAATRAVAMLEDDLDLALLSRTTRSVRLTERGATYAERCRMLLAEWDDARSQARGEDAAPRGLLSITAPVLFGRLHVLPIAEALLAEHEALSVRLTLVDRVVHLVEEGFDAAVRIGHLADSALMALKLAQVRRVVVAAPSYLAAYGEPQTPGDLKRHGVIAFEGVGATSDWRFGSLGEAAVTLHPRLSVNTADAAIEAALRGQGITRALSYQVHEAIAEARLVRILRSYEPEPFPVSLVYQANRQGSPNLAAFIKEARTRLAALDWD